MLERLLKDPNFLTNVFETMKEGLMVLDCDSTILFFNRAAEEITGYRREEVIGRKCMGLDTDTCVQLTDAGREKKCDLFKKGFLRNKRCRIPASDGRSVHVLKNAIVLKDDHGKTIGAVETITDITSLYMKEQEVEELKHELQQECRFMGLLGKGTPMLRLFEHIRDAASSEAPVLIFGESGTGKNLVAHAVHKLSRRKDGPFITMNCASLSDHLLESELFGHKRGSFTGALSDRIGRFEAANNGSIFLDEIGDMPLLMQAKLLRVLEEKVIERVGENTPTPVNIRLISATNKKLHELVALDRFREDLLYRLNSLVIRAPSLRERNEDIPIIVSHYLRKISAVNNKDIRSISPAAMDIIVNYNWPGNVRQLINALEHSAITCKGDTIEVSDLPDYIFQDKRPAANGKRAGREDIRLALSLCKGNKTLAAKRLGISRVTLWKRLKELGID